MMSRLLAIGLGLWGTAIIVVNASVVYRNVRYHRAVSPIGLVGGLSGLAACVMSGVPWIMRLWWLPLLLDWGSAPGMLYTVVRLVFSKKRRSDDDASCATPKKGTSEETKPQNPAD